MTQIEKLTSIVNLDQACQEILTGNLVAFPTETVFGLGANVEDESGNFIGYVMPEVDFKKSKSLENMLQKRMRQYHDLPGNYGYRISAAYNLSVAVAALHAVDHHIIDLKPTNCRLDPKRMLISIVDTDGFSISGSGSKRYHADQFTPEYIAPEALKKDAREVSETIGEQQDLFALAVIIFRLLNNGLHPFQALLPKGSPTELTQMIEKGYYAYGLKQRKDCQPAKQSIHTSFSNQLRKLFDCAFETNDRPKAKDWQKVLKKYADNRSGKLIQCSKDPDHAYFNRSKGCGWCRLETAGSLKGRSRTKNKTTKTRPKAGSRSSPIRKPSAAIQLNTLFPRLQGKKLGFILGSLLIVNFLVIQTGLDWNSDETPKQNKEVKVPKKKNNKSLKTPKETNKQTPKKTNKQQVQRPLKTAPGTLKQINKFGFLTAGARLRAARGKNSQILIELPKGTEIWILAKATDDNWYQVELKDRNNTLNIRGFIDSGVVAILK